MKSKAYNVFKHVFTGCMSLGFLVVCHYACVLFFGEYEYPTED